MILNRESLRDRVAWTAAGVALPAYDIAQVARQTIGAPIWVHFGASNIFRGFIAGLQQRLLNEGLCDKGIIVAETYDGGIVGSALTPHDHLTLNVTLNADATTDLAVIASVADGLDVSGPGPERERLLRIFSEPGLQMVSFTITEKGYALRGADGELLPMAAADMQNGPDAAGHAMGITAAALLARFNAGAHPLALVSMDNCARNGDVLRAAVLAIADAWVQNGFAAPGFAEYLRSGSVSFPFTMIDKITPRPDPGIEAMLRGKGIEGMSPILTEKGTYLAPFVNAERAQYLVIEDDFPGGRPPLEAAGVYMTDRETVNRTERMKVTTCLNPLHTAMSVHGCLLGHTLIHEEMKDADIVALIHRLGYIEGLPVATDPVILSPRAFLDEVMQERLPNPFLPDAPQRIATDTSQKVGIRFGETIKSYVEQGRDLNTLVAVPLALAGWLRYLLGVEDQGNAMAVSPDPLLETLQAALRGIVWNQPGSYAGQLRPILRNASIFGLDLTQTKLGAIIERYFAEMLAGTGAVRRTLQRHLA